MSDDITPLPWYVAEIECCRRKKRLIVKLLRSMGWSYSIVTHKNEGYYLDDFFIGETQLDVINTLMTHKDGQ